MGIIMHIQSLKGQQLHSSHFKDCIPSAALAQHNSTSAKRLCKKGNLSLHNSYHWEQGSYKVFLLLLGEIKASARYYIPLWCHEKNTMLQNVVWCYACMIRSTCVVDSHYEKIRTNTWQQSSSSLTRTRTQWEKHGVSCFNRQSIHF